VDIKIGVYQTIVNQRSTVFDILNNAYSKYNNPTEHSATSENIEFFKLNSSSDNVYARNTNVLESPSTNYVILKDMHAV
jgi:hypothetical protein